MHVLMDLRGSIPSFVKLTEGNVHDSQMIEAIPVEAGSYYLMDKGYVDLKSLYNHFQQNNAFCVTRAEDNMAYEVIESREVDANAGLISDETVRLTGYMRVRKYPDNLRLVVYEDFAAGVFYRFLSNNFTLEALTIAELYRERWQIELFFKWIKQHLHINTFYGTSQNAVYTQIWIAICDYLLIIAKKRFYIEESLHTISNSIGTILFKREDIHTIYSNTNFINSVPEPDSAQLALW